MSEPNVRIEYNSIQGAYSGNVSGSNGSFTFTVPAGVTEVTAVVIGAGGGGGGGASGSSSSSDHNGDGGKGAAAAAPPATEVIPVTAGADIAFTVGGGGGGGVGGNGPSGSDCSGAEPGTDGGAGGTTTFVTLSGAGGAGGARGIYDNNDPPTSGGSSELGTGGAGGSQGTDPGGTGGTGGVGSGGGGGGGGSDGECFSHDAGDGGRGGTGGTGRVDLFWTGGAPPSGIMSFSTLRDAYAGVDPVVFSDYYRGGPYVPIGESMKIPTSGTIKISDFDGHPPVMSNVIIDHGTVSGTNPETVTGGSGSWTFTHPHGIGGDYNIYLCGGGGSGGMVNQDDYPAGGGYAGAYTEAINQIIQVDPTIAITIGVGGAGLGLSNSNGNAGGTTTAGSLTAAGGAGGVYNGEPYAGAGAAVTSPYDGSTKYDGMWYSTGSWHYGYGGQASAFADGTDGSGMTGTTLAGTAGSGSGGITDGRSGTGGTGKGGDGRVVIEWVERQ